MTKSGSVVSTLLSGGSDKIPRKLGMTGVWLMKQYFVYIVASFSRRTYIGVTSQLERRVWQHRNGAFESHTKKYNKNRLVYFEELQWVNDAIAREKQIKGWNQRKKLDLIESMNPEWRDLSDGWFGLDESVADRG